MCRRRHCLTRETLSHPADSVSGRADNVWLGRQCLTWHTASLAGQTHPAGRLSDPAHILSDPTGTDRGEGSFNTNRSVDGDSSKLDRFDRLARLKVRSHGLTNRMVPRFVRTAGSHTSSMMMRRWSHPRRSRERFSLEDTRE